uniref:cell division cycle-associated protein 2 n=1 Tax=Centroberyx gerrardi TaxID=166262 RepID=UPI003AAD4C69
MAGTEGDEKVIAGLLPSSEEDYTCLLGDTSGPLDFSQLTPSEFGISSQSFTLSSANHKDKFRLAQLKARRRSNVGVRGSPATNSLIRYMAQQKIKTPPTHKTPEPVKSSPFVPRVASTLRQKMASFQSLMDVEESEVCGPTPRQDSETGGCIKTRDNLSDGRSLDGGKENCPPPMTPTPNKRRRVGPLRDCEEEIRGGNTPILRHISLKEQEVDKEPVTQVVTRGPTPSKQTVEEAQAVLFFPPLHLDSQLPTSCELKACSPTKNQQEGFFELQSPSRPQPDDPAAVLPAQPASPFPMPSLPSLLEMQPTGVCDSTATSTAKKKRVRFGGPLSPEFFDKYLPPSTPLQKGGTPARAPTPGVGLQLRSVLKTPQRSEPRTTLAQPDSSSPSAFGASPTLAMPRNRRMQPMGEDVEEMCGKIAFPSMEELDSSLTNNAERTWEAQPLDLNTAFQEESLPETLTAAAPEPEAEPSGPSQTDALDEPEPQPGTEIQPEPGIEAPVPAPARSSNRKRKRAPEPESPTEAPARSSSRRRKQPEESEPVKRSTRSAAKLASGKMKATSTNRRWGAKEVDRTLYGSREYASKNPTLSPITESLSSASQSPTQQPRSRGCTAAQDQEPCLSLPNVGELTNSDPATGAAVAAALLHSCSPTTNNTQETGDISTTNPWETPSEAPIESAAPSKRGAGGGQEGRRHSGPRLSSRAGRGVAGRGRKGRKVSVPVDDCLSEEPQDQRETGGKADERCEDQTTTNLETSEETLSDHIVTENREVDTEEHCPQTPVDAPCTGTEWNAERHESLDAPASACSPLDVEISKTASLSEEDLANQVKSAKRNAKSDVRVRSRSRGRRSSVNREEQVSQAAELQMGHKVEKGLRDQAAIQLETNTQSSSDSQALAPWQAEFNLEDVFKPVTPRGQCSVRRSLRNQSNADHSSGSSGLAWLPRTSPDSSRQAHRRTRGRRLSAALALRPAPPEETPR